MAYTYAQAAHFAAKAEASLAWVEAEGYWLIASDEQADAPPFLVARYRGYADACHRNARASTGKA